MRRAAHAQEARREFRRIVLEALLRDAEADERAGGRLGAGRRRRRIAELEERLAALGTPRAAPAPVAERLSAYLQQTSDAEPQPE